MKKIFKYFIIPTSVIYFLYQLWVENIELSLQSKLILIFLSILIICFILNSYFKNNIANHFPIFLLANIYFLISYICLFIFDKNIIFNFRKPTIFFIEDYNFALLILFYGYISFVAGYYLIIKNTVKYNRKGFDFFNLTNEEVYILGFTFVLINILLYYIIKIQIYFPSISQIKYPTLLTGIGFLTLYLSVNTENIFKYKSILCITLIILPLIFEVLSGSYSFPFVVIFMLTIFFSYCKKNFFVLPLFIIAILFIFIHIGKYEYRKIVWSKNFNQNDVSKLSVFIDVYSNIFKKGSKSFKKEVLCKESVKDVYCKQYEDLQLERRIFHSIESLFLVTKYTKKDDFDFDKSLELPHIRHGLKYVPFWNGYSYQILLTKVVPRIFWKNKPADTLGNEFGHRYNILNKDDLEKNTKKDLNTSWNMPVLNEFYVNFGKIGVIFGMFIIGILFGIIVKIASFENSKNAEFVVLFFLLLPLFFLESHLSLLLGAIIQSYIFLIFIIYIFLIILRKFYKV